MTADKDALLRGQFERWITAPPFEKDISRYGATGTYWPGCYEDYQVHLAWDAWKESARITAALAEKDDAPKDQEEVPPPFVATVRCPECWTYGHQHSKTCKHRDSGMANHVKISPPPLPKGDE